MAMPNLMHHMYQETIQELIRKLLDNPSSVWGLPLEIFTTLVH